MTLRALCATAYVDLVDGGDSVAADKFLAAPLPSIRDELRILSGAPERERREQERAERRAAVLALGGSVRRAG